MNPTRMKLTLGTCSVPRCKNRTEVVTLYAIDGPFKFCRDCAPAYERLGYRREPFGRAATS